MPQEVKVFIGSASESISIVNDLQELFEKNSLDINIQCQTWEQAFFEPADNYLENLTVKVKQFDFAVFIFTPDDCIKIRETNHRVTRDNVIFEMGLFTGHLGKDRTFFLTTRNTDYHLPSDLNGISSAEFDYNRYKDSGIEALGAPVNSIIRKIKKVGPRRINLVSANFCEKFNSTCADFEKEGFDLKEIRDFHKNFVKDISLIDIETFYKNSGLTYAYTERDEAYDYMLKDIAGAETRVSMYARVYLSRLIKGVDKFSKALTRAISKSSKSRFLVEQISTNYSLDSNMPIIERLWAHEDKHNDPKYIRRWPLIDDYVQHLKRSDVHFIGIMDAVNNDLPTGHKMERIEFRRAYVTNCLLPYSMLIIDEKIMYVSFYTLAAQGMPFGTFAPTLRLKCDQEDTWGNFFLSQIKRLERLHVDHGTVKRL